MKVVLAEDDEGKAASFRAFLASVGIEESAISTVGNLVDLTSVIGPRVDLCVLDLRLPAHDGAEPSRNGIAAVQMVNRSSGGQTKVIAISAYPDEFPEVKEQFERFNCLLVSYQDESTWKQALSIIAQQIRRTSRYDFLIFTALDEERVPYTSMTDINGKKVNADGIVRYDVSIAGRIGAVLVMPKMGLVDAAAMVSKAVDRFKPLLVCMSGICAGFEDRSELGQLLLAERCFEYQTGKWIGDAFAQEPYQVVMSERMRVLIQHLTDDSNLVRDFESSWDRDRPGKVSVPKLCPFTSGSAVIASADIMSEVATRHRKVAGLDMEIYALYRAAELSTPNPEYFAAKVVVDLGSQGKADHLHAYGSYISARFVRRVVEEFFNPLSSGGS